MTGAAEPSVPRVFIRQRHVDVGGVSAVDHVLAGRQLAHRSRAWSRRAMEVLYLTTADGGRQSPVVHRR
jgi:hypothetical protein